MLIVNGKIDRLTGRVDALEPTMQTVLTPIAGQSAAAPPQTPPATDQGQARAGQPQEAPLSATWYWGAVVPLPALLMEPQPAPAPLPEVVLPPHPQDRAHPREAAEHDQAKARSRSPARVPVSIDLMGASRGAALESAPDAR